MRISVFDRFGALNSAPVFAAIESGIRNLGLGFTRHDMTADVAVIWSVVWAGRMQSNIEVWRYFHQQGRPIIVAEVGTLRRGHTWKLGLNGTGLASARQDALEPNRAERLGIQLAPWKDTGNEIVVALQRQDSEQWSHAPRDWLDQTINELQRHTDRDIVIRPHPRYGAPALSGCQFQHPRRVNNTYDDYDLVSGISRAWAVINYNSGIASTAAIHGVPVFVGHDNLAGPVASTDLSLIESPLRPDRTHWLEMLCHTEWTLDELATGRPMARLLNHF